MGKKLNKVAQANRERAAIRKRLEDILAGVAGHASSSYRDCLATEAPSNISTHLGTEEFMRFIAAVENRFPAIEGYDATYALYNLWKFDCLGEAAQWLLAMGQKP